jgi:putative copper export protein
MSNMQAAVEALFRLALAFWVGGAALFTFVLTPILFRTQPRDLAAQIVGVLFPGYFWWGLATGTVALACLLILRGRSFLPTLALLLLMLGLTSFQAFSVEPRAAELKRQIVSFETTGKDNPLRRDFSRLHGISMACNLAVLLSGIVLIILPGRFRQPE